ncbi:MAG TPA: type 4a pilus biogenesis protein PilO [Pirellulales bacterium]|nr:type 4a pilus biogenesis protein PilO [Pirellulales bacterium]
MNTPSTNRATDNAKKKPIVNLHDPMQLRVFLGTVVLAVAYFAFYGPLSSTLDSSHTEFDSQLQRYTVICDIERLRDQYKLFKDRLPTNTDTNQWVHYLLDGARQFPLKLITLDPDKVRDVGPYKAVVVRIDLEGELAEIDKFIAWLETNERLIRVDSVNIQPLRDKGRALMATLTIVGLMG